MIGVFDSGVGGLTVAKEIIKNLPEHDLIYFGDTARAPYGSKSKETIVKYALEDADFLIKKGARILVVACNTASSLAYNELKEKYPGTPIFEVITPAVEAAMIASKNRRIGVIGTRATIKSEIYDKKLSSSCHSRTGRAGINSGGNPVIFSSACPLFVPLIEEDWLKTPELKMIARKYLSVFKNKNIDTLILGCTHYPIIKNIIQEKIGRRVKLIDSAGAVAQKVKEFLHNSDLELSKNKKVNIYFSDLTEQVKKITYGLIGADLSVEQYSNEKM
jgi:glutamate racemase